MREVQSTCLNSGLSEDSRRHSIFNRLTANCAPRCGRIAFTKLGEAIHHATTALRAKLISPGCAKNLACSWFFQDLAMIPSQAGIFDGFENTDLQLALFTFTGAV